LRDLMPQNESHLPGSTLLFRMRFYNMH
jgi:hypothetical protein